jgi:Lipocalin-like domain
MVAHPIVGTWRLESFEVRDDDGNVSYPMGPDAEGLITYTDDGRMAVQWGEANRPRLATPDWWSASDAEISAAARGFLAYSGTYEIRDSSVAHRIELSLMPNWVGEVFVRTVTFDGDTVTLSTPPTPIGGRQQVATLLWRRV